MHSYAQFRHCQWHLQHADGYHGPGVERANGVVASAFVEEEDPAFRRVPCGSIVCFSFRFLSGWLVADVTKPFKCLRHLHRPS